VNAGVFISQFLQDEGRLVSSVGWGNSGGG